MSINEFLKYELSGWKKSEIAGLGSVFLIIFLSTIINHDSLIAVMSAVFGILYTIIAGKGKISCYVFGLMGSWCYVYLSFSNAVYGNMLLYLLYYIPMQVLGIFKWRKHLKPKNREIEKTKLSASEIINLSIISMILCVIVILILSKTNDWNAVIDGITTVLSVVGMYLTVKRCIEQWIIWTFVNGLSVLMWLNIVANGTKAYATVIMWSVYFLLGIYFYFAWRKELDLKNQKAGE